MKPHHGKHRFSDVILGASQRAVTLAVVFLVICFIAWMAGLAALDDLPWILAGVLAGSFVAALVRLAGASRTSER